jgi:hypothetical protein
MGARPFLCALALTALPLSAPAALAAPVEGRIPPECGSRSALDDELRVRLGNDARVSDVHVVITPQGNGYHLRVAVGAEQRELQDPSCTELLRAAVVVAVSLLLQGAAPAPPPAPPPAVAPPPAAPRSSPLLGAGVGAGFSAGTLPKPVLTLEAEAQVLWRYLGLGVGVRYLLPAERRDDNRQGADLSALGATLTGIFRPAPAWEARLGLTVQRLSGTGVGSKSGSTDTVWAAGPALGLGWWPARYGAFRAGLGAEGQLNLARGRFEILNYSGELNGQRHVVYQVPWLAASAFVRWGLVW